MLDPARIPLSLYIHIPWCLRKCPYCDFNSHTRTADDNESAYVHHLLQDFSLDYDGRPLHSVFIGGGTPSLFHSEQIALLLDELRQRADFTDDCEITLEANPATFEQQKFSAYRQSGINRLSLGIQSLQPRHLQQLGRVHSADEAKQALRLAQSMGFHQINADVMFALPAQTLDEVRADLHEIITLGAEHISWYQLTIEPNTAFFARPPKALPDSDQQVELYENGSAFLRAQGFNQYEVSAWTKTTPAKHNMNYWLFGDYLGIGAGAHSKITTADGKIMRQSKYRAPAAYQARSGRNRNPYQDNCRRVPKTEQAFEVMMNGLRLRAGFPTAFLAQRSDLDLSDLMPTLLPLIDRGLIDADIAECIVTTPRGFSLLNNVLEAFL